MTEYSRLLPILPEQVSPGMIWFQRGEVTDIHRNRNGSWRITTKRRVQKLGGGWRTVHWVARSWPDNVPIRIVR